MRRSLLLLSLSMLCSPTALVADEGMFPISELSRLQLKSKGMELAPEDIFNSERISLVDGIVKVNGCTGSFVSDRGLIITNHHCAFDAIQKASRPDRDLLQNGFVAKSTSEEVPSPGYTVRITEGYRDVSEQVLSVVTSEMSFLERSKAIDKRRKEIEKQAEQENQGLRAEVAEMFTGKTYVLFLYTYLKDIRLAFAPPVSIGAFGGEEDNWEWPRHTGDFSFMRAYVAPDGSSAEYSEKNVPYKPKRFIPVSPKGANEEDFVFILGYPGRTVRQRTASFFRYEQQVRLPAIAEINAFQMNEMDKAGREDRSVAIRHASRFKSLANVEKRSRGQVLGLQRTGLIEVRAAEEKKLSDFIAQDPTRKTKYGQLLPEIDAVYAEMTKRGGEEIYLRELRTACRVLSFAFTLYDAAVETTKEDIEREAPYMNRNIQLTMQQLKLDIADWHPPTDLVILNEVVRRLRASKLDSANPVVHEWLGAVERDASLLSQIVNNSKLGDVRTVEEWQKKTPQELAALGDPALNTIIRLYPAYKELRDREKEREGKLQSLYGSWIEAKQLMQSDAFVPDANATLRITYGRVRGYSPADAIQKTPVSTLKGVVDKTTGHEPYITPKEVLDRYAAKDFGGFVHPKLGQVPVAILYNTDTTGGNSGSPVMNARGELVGVNFDRTFEATINDFAWNESYSRSIGVDIRYVLWVTGIVYNAKHLLDEMGVASK